MTKENLVEKFYNKLSKSYEKSHSSRFVDKIFEYFLFKYIPGRKNLRILDVGGGIGRFSFPLVEKGYDVTLTDISEGMLNKAKQISKQLGLNLRFFKESVTNMKHQKSEYYDVVLVMNGVLDYCSNYKKALKELHRVLKNKGRLIGTVNNRLIYGVVNILLEEKDINKFKKFYKKGNRFKKFPIHDFTLEELKEALTSSEFKIIEILGPTNLLRKWECEKVVTKNNEKKFLKLQIEFAKRKELLNNSTDFLFIAERL